LISEAPTVIPIKEHALRVNLIKEELLEFAEANTVTDIADALGDLLYVVLGSAVAYGIDLEPVFNEIHRSNMSKMWTEKEIEESLESDCEAWPVPSIAGDRNFAVLRKDGKIIKSPSYSPAKLKEMFQ
jgi:predicted HAD superfamily Cof-like phosphohydrolase